MALTAPVTYPAGMDSCPLYFLKINNLTPSQQQASFLNPLRCFIDQYDAEQNGAPLPPGLLDKLASWLFSMCASEGEPIADYTVQAYSDDLQSNIEKIDEALETGTMSEVMDRLLLLGKTYERYAQCPKGINVQTIVIDYYREKGEDFAGKIAELECQIGQRCIKLADDIGLKFIEESRNRGLKTLHRTTGIITPIALECTLDLAEIYTLQGQHAKARHFYTRMLSYVAKIDPSKIPFIEKKIQDLNTSL
ncbi:MAG: hypothetical protein H7A39_05250 [Chlamydiales bacterium]|nr:hypothetical protein [Chlamydiales bacterium]